LKSAAGGGGGGGGGGRKGVEKDNTGSSVRLQVLLSDKALREAGKEGRKGGREGVTEGKGGGGYTSRRG